MLTRWSYNPELHFQPLLICQLLRFSFTVFTQAGQGSGSRSILCTHTGSKFLIAAYPNYRTDHVLQRLMAYTIHTGAVTTFVTYINVVSTTVLTRLCSICSLLVIIFVRKYHLSLLILLTLLDSLLVSRIVLFSQGWPSPQANVSFYPFEMRLGV